MIMETNEKSRVKEKRMKRKFFNDIWKTFYQISVHFEKNNNDRFSNMFFEICSNVLNKEDYFFTQKAIENTLEMFYKDIDYNSRKELEKHLASIKKVTGTP